MTERSIRAIVVDDEALARRGIQIRLAGHADIEVVGTCENGREAIEAIAAVQPDLMFLDIQMPGLSGFDVLAAVPRESIPITVFTTAYDRYALSASRHRHSTIYSSPSTMCAFNRRSNACACIDSNERRSRSARNSCNC